MMPSVKDMGPRCACVVICDVRLNCCDNVTTSANEAKIFLNAASVSGSCAGGTYFRCSDWRCP